MFSLFISVWIKFFFVLAPFFVLSMFLTMTRGMEKKRRRYIAVKVTFTVIITCYILYFFGDVIFRLFGITVDSFRVGAGILLFMSAVDLVRQSKKVGVDHLETTDIAVVPLSIPITVGPATIGTLLVLGSESTTHMETVMGCLGVTAAVLCLGVILFTAVIIERILGEEGIVIMSKLTGLVLAALAAQIVLEGVRNILFVAA